MQQVSDRTLAKTSLCQTTIIALAKILAAEDLLSSACPEILEVLPSQI